ncbi:MAG: GyrI-like domain-containing protein [Saprospiraceae bacterium]|nr:GyrI-like domain-containing protein [Saprospiraceae bacterium]
MTNFKRYLIYAGLVVVFLIILSIFLAKEYLVVLERTYSVPKKILYNAINDLNTQKEWNAKATLDSTFQLSLSGQTKGRDASGSYTSKTYGDGNITINKDSVDLILMDDNGNNGKIKHYLYSFTEVDSVHTLLKVEAMSHSGFLSNLLHIIHKWKLKKQINISLDNLDILVKNRFENNIYRGYQIKETAMNQKFFISLRSEVAMENVGQYYTKNISALYQKAIQANITIAGMPCGLYYTWDEKIKKSDMAAALPTLAEVNIPEAETVNIPANTALIIEFKGDNSKAASAHFAIDDYMFDHDLINKAPVIEEYVTDPAKEADPAKWLTNIIYYVQTKETKK